MLDSRWEAGSENDGISLALRNRDNIWIGDLFRRRKVGVYARYSIEVWDGIAPSFKNGTPPSLKIQAACMSFLLVRINR
jgi:hypothetical protein